MNDAAARRALAHAVEAFVSFAREGHHPVDQRICRPHVEGPHTARLGAGREPGEVRDAPEIQNAPGLFRI